MSATSLLVSEEPAFESTWRIACEQAGLHVTSIQPENLSTLIESASSILIDGASPYFDEDELLAHVGLARALGKPVAVVVPVDGRLGAIEDLLTDLTLGLTIRADHNASTLLQVLMRRADKERSRRFEYLTVSPRASEVLAIMGDGRPALLKRPLSPGDDGSDIDAIDLGEDASSAELTLGSGAKITVDAASSVTQPGALNGITVSGSVDGAHLGARLRELRLAAGLTQAELARRTGIHRPNIARVEAGRHTPSLETLARLSGAIGVPTSAVLSAE